MWRDALRARLAGLLLLAGCLKAHGVGHAPLVHLPERASVSESDVPVLYVTDRAPLTAGDRAYGFDRGEVLRFGEAVVRLDRRAETSRVDELGVFDDDAFAATVRERLVQTDSRDVYLTVHGFASGFGRSLTDLAQIWHHLGRRGAAVAYSWPSGKGGFIQNAYQYERESGEWTAPRLARVLRVLQEMPEVEGVHVVAHSRGSAILLEALRHVRLLQLSEDGADAPVVDTLVLAAPDIDLDVFELRVLDEGLLDMADRTVLYVSERDTALAASGWMHGGSRVGTTSAAELERLVGAQLEVVDCSGLRGESHAYYVENPVVLDDLLGVLLRRSHRRSDLSADTLFRTMR